MSKMGYIKGYQFHTFKEYKTVRESVNSQDEVVEVVKKRIDYINKNGKPKRKIKKTFRQYPKINGVDIRNYLITPQEKQRCNHIVARLKDYVSPYYILYKCIMTGKIRYKGQYLRDYFDSNEQYVLAHSRIKAGWTVDRAINEKYTIYSFHDNGIKGVNFVRDKLGFKSNAQTMFYLKNKGFI